MRAVDLGVLRIPRKRPPVDLQKTLWTAVLWVSHILGKRPAGGTLNSLDGNQAGGRGRSQGATALQANCPGFLLDKLVDSQVLPALVVQLLGALRKVKLFKTSYGVLCAGSGT